MKRKAINRFDKKQYFAGDSFQQLSPATQITDRRESADESY